jgi:hypothetical protein
LRISSFAHRHICSMNGFPKATRAGALLSTCCYDCSWILNPEVTPLGDKTGFSDKSDILGYTRVCGSIKKVLKRSNKVKILCDAWCRSQSTFRLSKAPCRSCARSNSRASWVLPCWSGAGSATLTSAAASPPSFPPLHLAANSAVTLHPNPGITLICFLSFSGI